MEKDMYAGASASKARLGLEQLEDRLALDATSFVTSLYKNLLARAPDAAGLAFWVARINAGENNQAVATDFWRSAEHRGLQVDGLYNLILHRTADANGRAFWVNQFLSGATNEFSAEVSFLTSQENLNNNNTPSLFVQDLYLTCLNRQAGTSEINFWTAALANSNVTFVASSIFGSTESYTNIINNYYKNYLNRSPADSPGLSNWLNQLQSGRGTIESVAESILGSQEYANKH
jgi:hypothetical protein